MGHRNGTHKIQWGRAKIALLWTNATTTPAARPVRAADEWQKGNHVEIDPEVGLGSAWRCLYRIGHCATANRSVINRMLDAARKLPAYSCSWQRNRYNPVAVSGGREARYRPRRSDKATSSLHRCNAAIAGISLAIACMNASADTFDSFVNSSSIYNVPPQGRPEAPLSFYKASVCGSQENKIYASAGAAIQEATLPCNTYFVYPVSGLVRTLSVIGVQVGPPTLGNPFFIPPVEISQIVVAIRVDDPISGVYFVEQTGVLERFVRCPSGYGFVGIPMPSSACYPIAGKVDPRKPPECTEVGNPIKITTGDKIEIQPDITEGGGRQFKRVYFFSAGGADGSDRDNVPGIFGPNWYSTYERNVTYIADPHVATAFVARADGRRIPFAYMENGIPAAPAVAGPGARWVADSDIADKLVWTRDAQMNVVGWTYQTNEELETYDASGRLLTITNLHGQRQSLAYSDSGTPSWIAPRPGLLIGVTDSLQRTLSFTYDASGKLLTLRDSDNHEHVYAYDPAGNLATVTRPDASARQYVYNEAAYTGGANIPRALTGIIDESGSRYSTYQYQFGAPGRAVSTEHAGGVDRYSLQSGTGATLVTDPLGTQRTYFFAPVLGVNKVTGQSQPGGSGCGASSSSIGYDGNGNVSNRTDFDGHKSCHAYDLTRNIETKRVEGLAAGADCTASLTTSPAPTSVNPVRTINTQWHPDWRLDVKRAEPKKITTSVYNGQPDPTNGNAIASCAPGTALLPDGKPIVVLCKRIEQATTDATGASGFAAAATGSPRVSTWTYNLYGQVLTADGPRVDVSDVTSYTYYTDTTADHTLGDLATMTNPAGHTTTYNRYDKNGRLLQMTDANGLITTMSYSPRGWLKTRQVGTELTSYDYDAVGQLKKVTLPDASWIGYDYDPAHRLVATYDNQGNRIAYTLDNAGNRTQEDVTDPNGVLAKTHSRVYDALGRLQNVVLPQ